MRNEELHIRGTVAALQAQDFSGELEFLFIDGRSTDGTRDILEELAEQDPRIRVLDNPARHTASALNIGLRAARGIYVARIDAHAVYPRHYLSRSIERLRRNDVQWVAGPQVPIGRDPWSRRVALALGSPLATGGSNRWASDFERRDGSPGAEVELVTGVFTGVCRRELVERLGGWSEGWPINQDSELAARVRKSGGRIVSLADLAATYVPRSSLRHLARQYWRYGMYRAKTFLRHPETLRPTHVAMPAMVVTAVSALAAPPALRAVSRAAVGGYCAAVAAASVAAARGVTRDALALPAVFVTMHYAWGAGFLVGLVRFVPLARRAPERPDACG